MDEKQMLDLATRHAQYEAEQKIGPLMETLVPEPEYGFYPANLRMHGGDLCKRYYEQFFTDFMSKVRGHKLLNEWVSHDSVAQEYDITLRVDGELETHRVLGILFAEGDRLGGVRLYVGERAPVLSACRARVDFKPLLLCCLLPRRRGMRATSYSGGYPPPCWRSRRSWDA
ncbi:MAG: hypothetical protein H8E63_10330, partial [Proteobacteria bacterium]|nr:hypothetical protein [Pseudomonadota bacterium]